MSNTEKQRVQQQFGDKAGAYATSAVHAQGESLQRLLALTNPEATWTALDVATGAGHTAHTFAPHVRRVIASDITASMVEKAQTLARQLGHGNVGAAAADAEQLPFATGSLDLVACRLAAHHFPNIRAFVREAARVLKRGGLLAVSDNVVPGSTRSGRKARLQQEAGVYINAFEKLRDPSHVRHQTVTEWREHYRSCGFALEAEESSKKAMDFADYVRRSGVAADDIVRLRAMLVQAPDAVLEFLTPIFQDDTITFHLTEAIFIGRLE